MSRIQEILAKAERDGTARRTQAEPFTPAPPVPFAPAPAPAHVTTAATAAPAAPPRVDGSSALDPFPSGTMAAASSSLAPAPPPVVPSLAAVASQATAVTEPRAAVATLHPLLIAAINPHSPVAEQYRTIRSRISHREETTTIRTLLVTSPGPGDGKSMTVANLALTMAQEFQRRVVLVDADFRGSSIHSLFGLPGTPGLAELLAGEATLDDVMVQLPDYRLTIIPAGNTPQFPTELLSSSLMRRVVDTLRSRFDKVLFDMPAVTPLADVATFAPMADGVVMVVRAGVTLRPALNDALNVFDEEKVLGLVLNDTK
jgi:capsular exopolysaccharide synthesis family protein